MHRIVCHADSAAPTPASFSSSYPVRDYASASGLVDRREDDETKKRSVADPLVAWLRARSPEEKTFLGALGAVVALALLWFVVEDHDNLFVMAETVHFGGVAVLVYKLYTQKSCGGLSLRTQELTAAFLAVRLYCSVFLEFNIHTLLDFLTLTASLYAIYMMRFPLRATYQRQMDTFNNLYIIVPCALLAVVANPNVRHFFIHRVMWALCVYLEAVSVLPQLRMMQKSKVVERFTAHYVFALGLARFLSCAHWVLQIVDGDAAILKMLFTGSSHSIWPIFVVLSEIVQTFILADFCYHYVKSYADGTGLVRLQGMLPI